MSEDKQHKQVDGPPVEMSRYDEDADLEDCVSEVIVTVLDQLDFDISAKRMRLMENGLVAEVAMYKLQELVHLATVQHDGDWLPGQMLEVLVPDEEPVPAPVDNWARGSVPARVVKVNEGRFNDHLLNLSDGTRTPSVSSFRSSSTRSRSTNHSRAITSRGGGRHASSPDAADAPRIIELDDEASSFHGDNGSNVNSTGHMYDMLQKQKNRLKQLTHTDDTIKDEFQLLQEEVDRAAEDLKGKNYIFDQNGNIVLIQPLKSDQLPPFTFNPSLNVNNADSTLQEDPKKKQGSGGPGGNTETKKKKKLRVAGTRGLDDPNDKALFVPTKSLATTIAGNSHEIQVNNGVAIQTSKMSKEGPPIPDDPRKPSRKEFFTRKSTQAAGGGGGGGGGTGATSTMMESSWGDGTDSGGLREDSFNSSKYDSNDPPGFVGGSSTFTGGGRYKDIDPLEGGRPKLQASQTATLDTTSAGSGSSASASSSTHPSARVVEATSKTGKQPPAVEPTKPSVHQQHTINLLHGGSHMQGPRDRLPSQVLNSRSDKKKYIVPIRSTGSGDDNETQSFHSFSSKKSFASGIIKKEKLASHLDS